MLRTIPVVIVSLTLLLQTRTLAIPLRTLPTTSKQTNTTVVPGARILIILTTTTATTTITEGGEGEDGEEGEGGGAPRGVAGPSSLRTSTKIFNNGTRTSTRNLTRIASTSRQSTALFPPTTQNQVRLFQSNRAERLSNDGVLIGKRISEKGKQALRGEKNVSTIRFCTWIFC